MDACARAAARGSPLTAITSGGTIPDNADYNVVLELEGSIVGTVNEDFAVESLQGDIFQLGNTGSTVHGASLCANASVANSISSCRLRRPKMPSCFHSAPAIVSRLQKSPDTCLEEAMDIDGLERLLANIERGDINIVARDLTEPSPLALQILVARPYAYLDDAPLEERRTQAVMSRRWLDPQSASDLGRLDLKAIERVREEAFPGADNADELHDALMWCGFMTAAELAEKTPWSDLAAALVAVRRAALVRIPAGVLWAAAERMPRLAALFPRERFEPPIQAPEPYASETVTRESALTEIIRGRMEALGPVTAHALAAPLT